MAIELSHINLRFGADALLQNFSLTLPDRTVTCLCGPSGCGKTTLIRLLAGLTVSQGGTIAGLSGRRVGVLFQEHRLLPGATVLQNVMLAHPVPGAAARAEALRLLEAVGLGEAAAQYPDELSGGMQQRAAIARLLAFGGDVWLLDEPFKELDTETRGRVSALLQSAWREKTVVLVTHDRTEAEALGGRIVTLRGRPLCVESEEVFPARV